MPILLYIYSLLSERFYLFADSHDMAVIYHSIGLHTIIIIMSVCFACYISYNNLALKIAVSIFAFYRVLALLFYMYCQFNKSGEWFSTKSASDSIGLTAMQDLTVPIIISFLLYVLYVKLKRFDYKNSDYPNEKNILLLFRYPKNIIGLIISLFYKYPVNTISVYSLGFKYGFKSTSGKLERYSISHSELMSGKYFIKDTNLPGEDLSYYLDTKWSIFRNCFNVFKPVVGSLKNY